MGPGGPLVLPTEQLHMGRWLRMRVCQPPAAAAAGCARGLWRGLVQQCHSCGYAAAFWVRKQQARRAGVAAACCTAVAELGVLWLHSWSCALCCISVSCVVPTLAAHSAGPQQGGGWWRVWPAFAIPWLLRSCGLCYISIRCGFSTYAG